MKTEFRPYFDGGYSREIFPFPDAPKPCDGYNVDVRFTQQGELQGIRLELWYDYLSVEQVEQIIRALQLAITYAKGEDDI